MTEKEKIKLKRDWTDEFEYAVLPTGGNRTVLLLKDDIVEFVYYYKKPIEDILGDLWNDAHKSGDVQKFYTDWEARMVNSDIMYNKDTYSQFLKNMWEYIAIHGIWKDGWKD